MALSWALAALSLLPLLDAQSPVCANLTAEPITNATLDQVRPQPLSATGSCLLPWASLSPAGLWLASLPDSA